MKTTAAEQAVEKFIHYIESVRQLSAHTVAAYRRDLRTLTQGIGEQDPTTVTAIDLHRLLAQRSQAKATSIARQLAAWRAFYNFLISADCMRINPVLAVVAPKRPAHLPKALTPDEMNSLLATPTDKNDLLSVRDTAMMELLYSSALRLAELTQLNINDIDQAGGFIYVQRGKGGRGRVVPLGKTAAAALAVWLPQRQALLAGAAEPALFVGRNKTRLCGRSVQKRIDRHVKKIGFKQTVSPHMFRHSCASHFLQSSGDLRATQELLGHRDISATQIYTRLDFQHLANIYDKAHPRAKK